MKEQGTIRLADRILTTAHMGLIGDGGPEHLATIKEDGKTAPEKVANLRAFIANNPKVVIDDVAEFWSESESSKYVDYRKDFPNVAPPFNEFWMEYKVPKKYRDIGIGEAIGIVFQSKRCDTMDDLIAYLFDADFLLSSTSEKIDAISQELESTWDKVESPWIWVTEAIVFLAQDKDNYCPLGVGRMPISSQGQYLLNEVSMKLNVCVTRQDDVDEFGRYLMEFLRPALLAISFMHCKNVSTEEQAPPEQLSRAFQRRHGRPLLRFWTLEIEPMKEVLKTEGGIGHNGLRRALHICRGHFAHYNDTFLGRKLEKPITVWKPAHRRGSKEHGVVVKDYKVKAPAK